MSQDANEAIPEAQPEEIRRLERIAHASWPALEETSLGGWGVGSSGAYTRRANRVSPFAAPAEEGHFELLEARPSAAWLSASFSFSKVPDQRCSDYEAILERLRTEGRACGFGTWTVGGFTRSVALAVTCEGVTSFHQVATDPDVRGRRYADGVLRGLLTSVSGQGATSAMLSVEAENASARRLYDRLGFCEVYRYWYRER